MWWLKKNTIVSCHFSFHQSIEAMNMVGIPRMSMMSAPFFNTSGHLAVRSGFEHGEIYHPRSGDSNRDNEWTREVWIHCFFWGTKPNVQFFKTFQVLENTAIFVTGWSYDWQIRLVQLQAMCLFWDTLNNLIQNDIFGYHCVCNLL